MIINMNGAKAPETPSSVLQEKTVIPETLPTVIGPDAGYDGLTQVTINPDAQLKAENIRSGKTIFGVAGAFVGEPQFTDALDVNEVTGKAFTSNFTFPMFCAEPFNVMNNPSTVDSPFGSSRYTYQMGDSNWVLAGYASGAIAARTGKGEPGSSSTYIPSGPWYMSTGDIGGDVTFKTPGSISDNISKNCSHIRGTAYLCPAMGLTNLPSIDYTYTVNYPNNSFVDKPEFSIIELDHDLTIIDGRIAFTMTLPLKNYTIYTSTSSSVKIQFMTYVLMPIKIVIS